MRIISLEILSRPVAFSSEKFFTPQENSDNVNGCSIVSVNDALLTGLEQNYSEQLKLRYGFCMGSASSELSSYNCRKKEVRSSIATC